MQIYRGVKRDNEDNRWASPTPDMPFFNMAGAGYLDGLVGMEQGVGLDIVPKLAIRHFDDGETGRSDTKFEPGLDVFYKITPSLTAALTVNTDFGEAEPDTRQINLTRFSLFFPEKRQFFLQDAGIFDFAGIPEFPRPYFSRRIGLSNQGEEIKILAGAKITGRAGPFNIGLLDVVTDEYRRLEDEDTGGPREKIEVKNLAVARVSMNVLEESTAGFIVTHGDPNSNDDNLLYGLDFNYINSNWTEGRSLIARAWWQKSHTTGLEGNDMLFGGWVQYPNDRVSWELVFDHIEENFLPALGFLPRNGVRNYWGTYQYQIRPERFLRTAAARVEGLIVTDMSDEIETAFISFSPFILENPKGDRISFMYTRNYELTNESFEVVGIEVPAGRYGWNGYVLEMSSSDGRPLAVGFTLGWEDFFEGTRLDIISSLDWRPTRYFQLGLDYEQNDISLPTGDAVVHIGRARVVFQFSPTLSWNSFIQYDNVSDNVGINTRLRWIIRPGSEFFLVFNQALLIRDGQVRRGETEPRIKLGWTFRF
jgi:hypothetical protein